MRFFERQKKIFILAFIFLIVTLIFIFFLLGSLAGAQQPTSTEAPIVSDIRVEEVSEDKFTVTWKTNKPSDSLINYGVDKRYGMARNPVPDKQEHVIVIDQLEPSTEYHFRIVSTDVDGNQSISGNLKVKTAGIRDIPDLDQVDPDQRPLVERAIAIIDQITDPDALEVVSDHIRAVARDIVEELVVLGEPRVDVGVTTATVRWFTNLPANSRVEFERQDVFDPNAPRYSYSQGGLDEAVTEHVVELIGLIPFTTYHFQVISEDRFGLTGRSFDAVFTTEAEKPVIQNIDLIKVEEESATLSWSTTLPATALVEFENLETGEFRSQGSPTFSTVHTVQLLDLEFGTRYRARVIAENQGGDKVESDFIEFITVLDVEPPIITNVSNESTLYPGSESRVQTVISWDTDEPAICQLFYQQGLAPGADTEEIAIRDISYLTKHVQVMVGFRPATVYKYWIICEDRAENKKQSEDFVLFTPQHEKSIIDIILENFEGTFGWVKNIRR
jgi:hypothetical protein